MEEWGPRIYADLRRKKEKKRIGIDFVLFQSYIIVMTLVFNPSAFLNTNIQCRKKEMPILTDQEAEELDELLTRTIPETNPNVQGPFIKNRENLVILDTFSAKYLKARMLATQQAPSVLIHKMIRREMANAGISV